MAFSTTLLAWSFLEFETAYIASKQYYDTVNAILWSADYFVKCHVSTFEYFGQVRFSIFFCFLIVGKFVFASSIETHTVYNRTFLFDLN